MEKDGPLGNDGLEKCSMSGHLFGNARSRIGDSQTLAFPIGDWERVPIGWPVHHWVIKEGVLRSRSARTYGFAAPF